MGDLASDRIAAIELIIDEYHRLCTHSPDHELLKYITSVNENGFEFSPDQERKEKFLDIYAPDERTPVAVMLTRYFVALRNAADEIEGIDRYPKPKESSASTPQNVVVTSIKKLDNLGDWPVDDDIPF